MPTSCTQNTDRHYTVLRQGKGHRLCIIANENQTQWTHEELVFQTNTVTLTTSCNMCTAGNTTALNVTPVGQMFRPSEKGPRSGKIRTSLDVNLRVLFPILLHILLLHFTGFHVASVWLVNLLLPLRNKALITIAIMMRGLQK